MAVERPTCPIDLDLEEQKLLHEIRELHANSIGLIKTSEYPQFNQTLDLSVFSGCNQLGRYDIDPLNMVREFALAGVNMLQRLIKGNTELETRPEEVNDSDSVFGSQPQNEARDSDKTQAWILNIPPCVTNVIFTVSKEDNTSNVTTMLKEQFPGVDVCTEPVQLNDEEAKNSVETQKPRGVKRAVIELDPFETADNPHLETQLQEQFPWASFESNPGLDTSRTRTLSTGESSPASIQRLDPLQHLRDLANYSTGPPPNTQFEYAMSVTRNWTTFSYNRKLEIAHARAIQVLWGRKVDSGCSYCVEHGYECKVYRPQIGNLSHIDFGHSCQHCRLTQQKCDLPAAIGARHVQTLSRPATELRINTQMEQHVPSASAAMTPSTAVTPKSSLESRMTMGQSSLPEDDSKAYVEEDFILTKELIKTLQPSRDILCTASYIDLRLSGQSNSVIMAMYKQWKSAGVVEPAGHQMIRVQKYYNSLLALYILAWARQEMDLAYRVLLRLQTMVSQPKSDNTLNELPSVEIAVLAYQWLPSDAPLCRYIANIFAFLWGTQTQGHYSTFVKNYPQLDRSAFTKLLYAITYIRDPFVEGHDAAVLSSWCQYHDHSSGDGDDLELCQEMRETVQKPLVEREKPRKGKRKAEGSPAFTFGKKRQDSCKRRR